MKLEDYKDIDCGDDDHTFLYCTVILLVLFTFICLLGYTLIANKVEQKIIGEPVIEEEEFYSCDPDIYEAEPVKVSIEVVEIEPLYSDHEIDLMARVVMSEASILNEYDGLGKQAVAEVIINRANYYGHSIEETINYGLSTQDNGDPTEECYEAVRRAIEDNIFPDDMLYFRTDYYHTFAKDYIQIGNTYFSTLIDYNEMDYGEWPCLMEE